MKKGSSKVTEADRLDVRSKYARRHLCWQRDKGQATNHEGICGTLRCTLPESKLSIHRAWLWREMSPQAQRQTLMQHRGEKGTRKTIQGLVSKHVPKGAVGTTVTIGLGDLTQCLSQLQSSQFSSVAVVPVNVPGKSYLCNRGTAQILEVQEENCQFDALQKTIKQILIDTQDCWDHPGTRPAVRENFSRVINCRTPALETEIYASVTEEKLVYHTWKSRACPSCGLDHAALATRTVSFCRTFHIQESYSPCRMFLVNFQQNRHLLHDLPALGAAVIQQWIKLKYGARVLIMGITAHLRFPTCSIRTYIFWSRSRRPEGFKWTRWVERLRFDNKKLMHMALRGHHIPQRSAESWRAQVTVAARCSPSSLGRPVPMVEHPCRLLPIEKEQLDMQGASLADHLLLNTV